MTIVTKGKVNATGAIHEGIMFVSRLIAFSGLVVSYNTSMFDRFHFLEKLGEILFEGVLLDEFQNGNR